MTKQTFFRLIYVFTLVLAVNNFMWAQSSSPFPVKLRWRYLCRSRDRSKALMEIYSRISPLKEQNCYFLKKLLILETFANFTPIYYLYIISNSVWLIDLMK